MLETTPRMDAIAEYALLLLIPVTIMLFILFNS